MEEATIYEVLDYAHANAKYIIAVQDYTSGNNTIEIFLVTPEMILLKKIFHLKNPNTKVSQRENIAKIRSVANKHMEDLYCKNMWSGGYIGPIIYKNKKEYDLELYALTRYIEQKISWRGVKEVYSILESGELRGSSYTVWNLKHLRDYMLKYKFVKYFCMNFRGVDNIDLVKRRHDKFATINDIITIVSIDDNGNYSCDKVWIRDRGTYAALTDRINALTDLTDKRIQSLFKSNLMGYSPDKFKGPDGLNPHCREEKKLIKECRRKDDVINWIMMNELSSSIVAEESIRVDIHMKGDQNGFRYYKKGEDVLESIRVEVPIIKRKCTKEEILQVLEKREDELMRIAMCAIKRRAKVLKVKNIKKLICTECIYRFDSVLQYTLVPKES